MSRYNLSDYASRKKIEYILRKLPNIISNILIDLVNPIRKKIVINNIHPKWITLFITNFCSARCEHCFYSKELNNKVEELNLENLKKIFSSLKKPLNTLRVTGGEPFLNKNLENFIIFIDQYKLSKKVSITTHGMIPKLDERVKNMLQKLKYVHLHIGVSLDGLNETHDAFRKIKNGFNLAIKHLSDFRNFTDHYKRFTFSTTTSLIRKISIKKNKDDETLELFELLKYLKKEVGVPSVGFDHIRTIKDDVFNVPNEILSDFGLPPKKNDATKIKHTRADDVQLSINEIEEVNNELNKSGFLGNDYLTIRRLEIEHEILNTKKRIVDCLAGYIDCVIYPSLDVSVCESTKPFANLNSFNFNLLKLLNSDDAIERRKITNKCSCTHPCHLSDSMAYDTKFLKEYFSSKRL
ncbi:MAG: radical SAM protein [Candidatus Pelagibacter sp.]